MITLPDRQRWLSELSFLEQKDGSVPLPAYTPHLIEVMKTVRQDHLPWTLFVEGMVILLAADPDFLHADAYRTRLQADPAVRIALLAKMNELLDERHPLAFPYAVTLYAMEEEPQSASALAQMYLSVDPDVSKQLAESVSDTNDPVALTRLLEVYRNLGEEDKTNGLLKRLIDQNAPGEEIYRAQLRSLQQQQAERDAEAALMREDFHRIIDIVDEIGETLRTGTLYALRGTANQGLGLFDASIRDLEQAIDAGVVTPAIYNDLSIAYYLTGQAEEAMQTLQDGRKKAGDDERMLYNLFVYAIQADRTELALETLETLKTMELQDPQIRADVQKLLGE